jgi:hypothetical protein
MNPFVALSVDFAVTQQFSGFRSEADTQRAALIKLDL